jgi:hypothetical protein
VDPDLVSHRAFGITQLPVTPAVLSALETVKTDVMGELPEPVPLSQVMQVLQEKDRFALTASDNREAAEQFPLETGQFLVDRDGIVRWAHLEVAQGGLVKFGQFPNDEDLLQVARAHAG